MARKSTKLYVPRSLSDHIANDKLAEAYFKAETAKEDGIRHASGYAGCVTCDHIFAPGGDREAHVRQMLNAGGFAQYQCGVCDGDVHPDDEPYTEEAYLRPKGDCVYFQLYVEMDYNGHVAAELMQGASRDSATTHKGEGRWRQCPHGMKSPILRNTKSLKVLKTLEEHELLGNAEVFRVHVAPYWSLSDGRLIQRETIILPWERTWWQQSAKTKMLLYKSEYFRKTLKHIKSCITKEMKLYLKAAK